MCLTSIENQGQILQLITYICLFYSTVDSCVGNNNNTVPVLPQRNSLTLPCTAESSKVSKIPNKMEVLNDPGSPETYKEILKRKGINSQVKEVQIKIPSLVGDQFASQCKVVKVIFSDENLPPLDFFVKVAAANKEFADQMSDVLMFEKESLYFSTLLPEIQEFLEAQPGYDGFLKGLVPKCYYSSDQFIVFENLLSDGYVMLNKIDRHDLHTTKLVLKQLARFHGGTITFLQSIGEEKFLNKYSLVASKSVWSEEGEIVNGTWTQNAVDGAIKILSSKPTLGSDKALNFFKKFEKRGFLRLCSQYRYDNQACSLSINHGDVWNGNLMFQRNTETKKPETCLLIDLQTIHLGSPALDLVFYIFGAVDSELRWKQWRSLLRIYYDDLEDVVTQKLGKKLKFSFEDLVSDFCSKSETGFFFGMYAIFGFEALSDAGDVVNSGGNAMENLSIAISSYLDKVMEQKGTIFSEKIVRAYEEFLDISAGKSI